MIVHFAQCNSATESNVSGADHGGILLLTLDELLDSVALSFELSVQIHTTNTHTDANTNAKIDILSQVLNLVDLVLN